MTPPANPAASSPGLRPRKTFGILRGMDWLTLGIVLGVVGTWLLWRQIGLVSATATRDYLRQGAKVVDVRSAAEFQAGHLAGALNVPLGELDARIPSLVPDKDTILLLHCLSGGRSAVAQGRLRHLGYHRAYNLGSYRRAERLVAAPRP